MDINTNIHMIKNIQDNINENDCMELDFFTNISLVITKNELYLLRWEPGMPKTPDIPIWFSNFRDNFDNYDYKQITTLSSEEINDIIQQAFKECKFTITNGIY